MNIDFYILLAQILNFGILYFVFRKFIGKKIEQRIQERKEQLQKLELADQQYQEKMELAETQRQEILETAKKTSRDLMRESEILANARATAIQEEAHTKALAILDWGRRELEKERKTMLAQMKSHILDISLKLNEKIFQSEENSREFLEKELEKMK